MEKVDNKTFSQLSVSEDQVSKDLVLTLDSINTIKEIQKYFKICKFIVSLSSTVHTLPYY